MVCNRNKTSNHDKQHRQHFLFHFLILWTSFYAWEISSLKKRTMHNSIFIRTLMNHELRLRMAHSLLLSFLCISINWSGWKNIVFRKSLNFLKWCWLLFWCKCGNKNICWFMWTRSILIQANEPQLWWVRAVISCD